MDLVKEDNEQLIKSVLATLSPREANVIKMRFGLETGQAMTLEEIGMKYGVTKERIRQIEAKALRKLRNPIRLNILKEVEVY